MQHSQRNELLPLAVYSLRGLGFTGSSAFIFFEIASDI